MTWIHDMLEIPEDKIEQFEAYCEIEAAQDRTADEDRDGYTYQLVPRE